MNASGIIVIVCCLGLSIAFVSIIADRLEQPRPVGRRRIHRAPPDPPQTHVRRVPPRPYDWTREREHLTRSFWGDTDERA